MRSETDLKQERVALQERKETIFLQVIALVSCKKNQIASSVSIKYQLTFGKKQVACIKVLDCKYQGVRYQESDMMYPISSSRIE